MATQSAADLAFKRKRDSTDMANAIPEADTNFSLGTFAKTSAARPTTAGRTTTNTNAQAARNLNFSGSLTISGF